MTEEYSEPIEEPTEPPQKVRRERTESQKQALAAARVKALEVRRQRAKENAEAKVASKQPKPIEVQVQETPIQEPKVPPVQDEVPVVEKKQPAPLPQPSISKDDIKNMFKEFHQERKLAKAKAKQEEEAAKPPERQSKFKWDSMLQRFVYQG